MKAVQKICSPLGSWLAGLYRPDVIKTQCLASHPPTSAFHLLDYNPGSLTEILTCKRDHYLRDLLNHLLRLFIGEFTLKQFYFNEWHGNLSLNSSL